MAAARPFVGENPRAYDFGLVIAGIPVPGSHEVKFKKLPTQWDKKPQNGVGGAVYTMQGVRPGEFDLVVTIVKKADDLAFDKLVPILRLSKESKPKKALDVLHPELARWGVTSLVVDNLVPVTKRKILTVTIECTQYMPAAKKKQGATVQAGQDNVFGAAGAAALISDLARLNQVVSRAGALAPPSQTKRRP